jgi:flagellar biosynthetic protein FlhB
MFRLLAVLILVAIIDWLFTRWEHQRKMRMTRKELKDEMKRREGDPQIRQKRKSLERELRKRSESLASVPEADLVITNPTRFAVVLKYDRQTMIAPQVTGKGSGEMAHLIREKAYKHRIPVINSPALARALFRKCPIHGAVAQEHYVSLASLFRQAYAMRDAREVSA